MAVSCPYSGLGSFRVRRNSVIVPAECDNSVTDIEHQKGRLSVRLLENDRNNCALLLMGTVIFDCALPSAIS